MAMLGILFFEFFFKNLVSPEDAKQYIAGMILLGVAPCTAMVFVWSTLTKGDPNYTLLQVSINDLIMIFAFAPLVAIYLGVTEINVPWNTLIISVVLYVVVPLIFGYFIRQFILSNDDVRIISFNQNFKPIIILALLLTVVLLFGYPHCNSTSYTNLWYLFHRLFYFLHLETTSSNRWACLFDRNFKLF